MWQKLSLSYFFYLNIFWPSWHILAFEKLVWFLQSITGLFGSMIIPYGCFESNFEIFDQQIWHLAFVAVVAAFFAFMAFKHQTTKIAKSLPPNGPRNMKKIVNFSQFDPEAFRMAFVTFDGLFRSLRDSWWLTRPVHQKNV